MQASGFLDFDDLLLHSVRLLKTDDQIREEYCRQWMHILVDEFQDTSSLQYTLIKLLAVNGNLMTVGDSNQCIYSWRQADIANLLRLQADFAQLRTHYLNRNYRSTGKIMRCATALLRWQAERNAMIPELSSVNSDGAAVQLHYFGDDEQEAAYISSYIHERVNDGWPLSDFALLYRTNTLTAPLHQLVCE